MGFLNRRIQNFRKKFTIFSGAMDQSEMMMIPNTPTLVAEENVNLSFSRPPLYSPIFQVNYSKANRYPKNEPAAPQAQESMAREQVAMCQPAQFPRQRGPAIKEKLSTGGESTRDRLPEVGEYFENEKGDRFVFRTKLGDGAMGHVFLSTHAGRLVGLTSFRGLGAFLDP